MAISMDGFDRAPQPTRTQPTEPSVPVDAKVIEAAGTDVVNDQENISSVPKVLGATAIRRPDLTTSEMLDIMTRQNRKKPTAFRKIFKSK